MRRMLPTPDEILCGDDWLQVKHLFNGTRSLKRFAAICNALAQELLKLHAAGVRIPNGIFDGWGTFEVRKPPAKKSLKKVRRRV